VPHNSTTGRIYDPVTDTVETPSDSYPGSNAFAGGVLLPDGRVCCVPANSGVVTLVGSPLSHPLAPERVLSPFFNKF
jgi:hypothetical protein